MKLAFAPLLQVSCLLLAFFQPVQSDLVDDSGLRGSSGKLLNGGESQRGLVEEKRTLDGPVPGVLYTFEIPKLHRPLGLCWGDCNSDLDCEGNLVCMKRRGNGPVPGCSIGEALEGIDYCVDPKVMAGPPPGVLHRFDNAKVNRPLGRCQGDCNNDSHCLKGLVCTKRSGNSPIPSCLGTPLFGIDYCLDPNAPAVSQPTVPTDSDDPEPLPSCRCCKKINKSGIKNPLLASLFLRIEKLEKCMSTRCVVGSVKKLRKLRRWANSEKMLTKRQQKVLKNCIQNEEKHKMVQLGG